MPPRVPRNTRILMIPSDDGPSREYSISRAMVIGLIVLLVIFAVLLALLLLSYTSLVQQGQLLPEMRRDLQVAQARVAQVQQLNQELEQMRSMQERLLIMLGVEPQAVAAQDTLAGFDPYETAADEAVATETVAVDQGAALDRSAALVITPPPSFWPAAGFVTREFYQGDAQRGVLPHFGMDIAAPEDSPILAAGRGRVMKARWDDYLGNFVEIQHGFQYVTVYGHCSRLAVREGDRIDQGQLIGYLGGTGQASAPHLHFEVWKDGEAVDPRQILPGEPPR